MGLLEFLNQTIRRPSELATLLQTEPLSVLPYIETAPRRAPLGGANSSFARPDGAAEGGLNETGVSRCNERD